MRSHLLQTAITALIRSPSNAMALASIPSTSALAAPIPLTL